MRGKFVLAFLVLIPVAVVAAADDPKKDTKPPDGWKEVAGGYKKQAYKVWLPTDGKTESDESSLFDKAYGQIRVFRTNCERKDGTLFITGQVNLPPKLTKATLKVRQNFFRDSFLEEVDGKVTEEKNIKLGTMNGKEYVIKTPKGMARYRLIGTGVQIFRAAIVGSKEVVTGKDADTFFDSFQRTPPKEDKKDK
jgi:hypothetical protein